MLGPVERHCERDWAVYLLAHAGARPVDAPASPRVSGDPGVRVGVQVRVVEMHEPASINAACKRALAGICRDRPTFS